jgi:succinate dehydrogenase / fumarate reductase cytochrome b subunit
MRIFKFYKTSVGKKVVVAITGFILFAFLVLHMLGNLNIYSGAEKIDAYSLYLRQFAEGFFGFGGFLWIVRVVLLSAFILHIWTIVLLVKQNYRARPIRYKRKKRFAATLAGITMLATGPIILIYLVLHILQFTTGTIQPTPYRVTDAGIGSAYWNLWMAFQVWWIAWAYIAVMAMVCLHLKHGLWSMFQSVGLNNPDRNRSAHVFAYVGAFAIFIGFASVPLLVWTGVVPPPPQHTNAIDAALPSIAPTLSVEEK